MTNPVLTRRRWPAPNAAGPSSPASPAGRSPPPGTATSTPPPTPPRSATGSARHPDRNLAVATGAPGPDVLDIDTRCPAGSGFPALPRLRAAGLLDGAAASVRTPSGGLHSTSPAPPAQRPPARPPHRLPRRRAATSSSRPRRSTERPTGTLKTLGGRGGLDWHAAARLLEPSREHRQRQAAPAEPPEEQVTALARWVAAQPEGNRNAGLFWAANRALEADQAADLSPLAAAARQAGLDDPEITRTLNSARRTTQARPEPPDRQAEGEH